VRNTAPRTLVHDSHKVCKLVVPARDGTRTVECVAYIINATLREVASQGCISSSFRSRIPFSGANTDATLHSAGDFDWHGVSDLQQKPSVREIKNESANL
jgi:hypothetical protein